ncbi:hypothetical protein CTA1_9456 [Colletotrichum tanaceti]|uniref:Uncharacterized protein n=1 Tax=Colletotrichum tanaceti TaxID=1306861 RepID=A0A4U6X1B7_9PEZI|nr:hypothetical protein CTA1_9456 [Colletotrichum tanaceti]
MSSCGTRHLSGCRIAVMYAGTMCSNPHPQFPGGRLPHLTSPSQLGALMPSCAGQLQRAGFLAPWVMSEPTSRLPITPIRAFRSTESTCKKEPDPISRNLLPSSSLPYINAPPHHAPPPSKKKQNKTGKAEGMRQKTMEQLQGAEVVEGVDVYITY